jgi:hypothetical protein
MEGTEANINVFQILILEGEQDSNVNSYRFLHVQGHFIPPRKNERSLWTGQM